MMIFAFGIEASAWRAHSDPAAAGGTCSPA